MPTNVMLGSETLSSAYPRLGIVLAGVGVALHFALPLLAIDLVFLAAGSFGAGVALPATSLDRDSSPIGEVSAAVTAIPRVRPERPVIPAGSCRA